VRLLIEKILPISIKLDTPNTFGCLFLAFSFASRISPSRCNTVVMNYFGYLELRRECALLDKPLWPLQTKSPSYPSRVCSPVGLYFRCAPRGGSIAERLHVTWIASLHAASFWQVTLPTIVRLIVEGLFYFSVRCGVSLSWRKYRAERKVKEEKEEYTDISSDLHYTTMQHPAVFFLWSLALTVHKESDGK